MTSPEKTQIDPVVAAIPQPPADNAPPASAPSSGKTGKGPIVAGAIVALAAGAAYAEKLRRDRMTNLARLRRMTQSRRSPSLISRVDRLRSSVR